VRELKVIVVAADLRRIGRIAAMVAASLLGAPAWSQTQDQVTWCLNTGNAYPPPVRMAGCSAVIESGQWSGSNVVWAYFNRGLSYVEMGDFRALTDFDEAIRIDPNNARMFLERGRAVAGLLGDLDRAVRDLDQALALDPDLVDAHIYRAGIHRRRGDYDRAILDFTAALAVDDDARIHVARGGAYRAKGDDKHAVEDFDEALTLVPGRTAFIDSRGQANFSMARYAEAAADFTAVLDLDAASASAALWLYLSRARAGDTIGAATDLALRAPKLRQPEWPFPAVELFLGRGAPEATLKAPKTYGERCEALIYVGEWHLLRGDDAAAAALFKTMDACPKYFIDYHEMAQAELKRLAK
jgi:lipoprotein NlpI